jgi:hypothetical protein
MDYDLIFQANSSNVFWGEIAPWEHVAQFYTHDGVLLDTLTGFCWGRPENGREHNRDRH